MRKVLLVAWREFKHTALTKAFIIGAVMVPLGIGALMLAMPMLMSTPLAPLQGNLAVIDLAGGIAPIIQSELQPERVALRWHRQLKEFGGRSASKIEGVSDATLSQAVRIDVNVRAFTDLSQFDSLKEQVRNGELVALAVISPHALQPNSQDEAHYQLFVASEASPHHTRMFEDSIGEALVRSRVEHAGMGLEEAKALVRQPTSDVKRLAPSGAESADSAELKLLIPVAFMGLLWISTFTSGNYLLTSTIEEKSNKVMEVLLSAVNPFQLMAGKILGQAGVSFIMLAMYAGVGLIALAAAAKMDLIPPILLVYLVIFFFMAFFMVAAMMAGVGSAVNELRDAQSLITPAMLVLMVPLFLWFPITNAPNGALATITSFLPPLTPFVMILRVTTATEPVPTWQIIGSILAGYCWTIIMIWGSAKIFRIGVLMYGKPPTPLELLRWIRYS